MDTTAPPDLASKNLHHRTTATKDRQVWMLTLTKAPLTSKISAANIISKQRRSTTPTTQINHRTTTVKDKATATATDTATTITTARYPPGFTNELQASHFHDRRRLISYDDNDTLVNKATNNATTTSATATISSSIPFHGISELEALSDDPPTEEPTVTPSSLLKKIQRMKLELKTKNHQNRNSWNLGKQKEDEDDESQEEDQQHHYFIQAHPYQQLLKQQRQQDQDQGGQARSSPTTAHRVGGSRLVRRSIRQKPTISSAQAYMAAIQSKTKTSTSTPKVKARKAMGTAVKAKAKRPPKVTPSLKGSPTVPVVVVPRGRTTVQQRSRRATGGGGGITATAALSPSSSPLSVAVQVVPRRRKRTPQRKRKGGVTITNYSTRTKSSTVIKNPRISDLFSQEQQQDQDYQTSASTRTRTLAECLAAFPADRRGSTASVFVPVSASAGASATMLTRTRSQPRRPSPPEDPQEVAVEEQQHVHFISTAATAAGTAGTAPIPQCGSGVPSFPMPWTRIIRPDFSYRGRNSHEASSSTMASSSSKSSSSESDNDTSSKNDEDNKKPAFDESKLYNRLIQDLSRNEISIVVDVFGDQDDTDDDTEEDADDEDDDEDIEQKDQGEAEEEEDDDNKEVRDLMMHRPQTMATGTIGSTLYETHGRFFDPKKMHEYGVPPPNYQYSPLGRNSIRRHSSIQQVARHNNTNHAGETTTTVPVPSLLQVLPPLPPRGSSVHVPPHSTTCTRELNAKVVRLIHNSCIAPPKGLQQLPRLSLSCSSAPTSPTTATTMIARATDTQLFQLVQMDNSTVLPPSLLRRPSSTPTLPSAARYGNRNYYDSTNRSNSNNSNSNWRHTTTSTLYGGATTTTATTRTSPLVRRQSKKAATSTALTVDHGNDVIQNSNSNSIRNTAVNNVGDSTATTATTTTTTSPAVVGQSRHANNVFRSNNPDNANTNARPRTLFNHNGFERMQTGDNTGFFEMTLGSIGTNHGTEGRGGGHGPGGDGNHTTVTENRKVESRAALVARQMRRLGQDLRFRSSDDDDVNGNGDGNGNGNGNGDGNGDDGTTNGSSTHTTTTTCTHAAADDDDDHDDVRCMLEDTITTRLARASTKDLIAIAQNLMEEDTTSTTPPTPRNNIDWMLDDEGKRIVDIHINDNEKKKVVHASFESVAAAAATAIWGTSTATTATTTSVEPATSGTTITTTTIANRKKRNRKNKMKTSHNDDDSSPSSSSLSSRPSKKKSRSLGRRRSSSSSSSSLSSSSSSHRRFLPSVRKTACTVTAMDTATGTATATSGEDEPTTILLVGPGLDHNKVTIWNGHLNEAKQFIDTYGHSRIPTNYPTNPTLGGWAKRQRYQYKIYMKYSSDPNTTITTAKEARLKQETTKTTHTNNDADGDTDVDDDDNDDDESNMSNNVGVVRCQMNPERIQALNKIGFSLDLQVDGWEAKYQAVAVYLKSYHGMYPPNYQGSTHEQDIAQWIATQRYQMTLLEQGKSSYLTPERITKLNSIHFVWRVEEGVKLTRSFKKVKKTHHDENEK